MRRLALAASIAFCSLMLGGCKHAGELPALQREQQERDELQTLQDELGQAKQELSDLRDRELQRRAAELGVPTARQLLVDLGALLALLGDARAKIEAKEPDAAAALLRRASDVLGFTSARMPRPQIAARLARARSALPLAEQGESAGGERGWEPARLHVEEARAVCAGARSRPMHVELDADLESLLGVIDQGNAKQAHADIADLLQTELAPTEGELLLGRADWYIDAAIEALGRDGLSAARACVGDAEAALGKIVTGLGGSTPAQREQVRAAAPPAEQSPTPTPLPTTPEKPPAGSDAAAEPAPVGEESDDAGKADEAAASTASEKAGGESEAGKASD